EEGTRRGGPSALAMSQDGTRIAVADYTADVPGYHADGDRRVYVLRLDPGTGRLRVDNSFRDEVSGAVGVDFDRGAWPHGTTGAPRPHGLLVVAGGGGMSPPAVRPLEERDVERAGDVNFVAFHDVALRHGLRPIVTTPAEARSYLRHLLAFDPLGGLVAEKD